MARYGEVTVEETVLKAVVIAGIIILGTIIAIMIFDYDSIGTTWKVAISSFSLLLPFCYFLQALLNVKSTTDERKSEMERRLREFYFNNQVKIEKALSDQFEHIQLENNYIFSRAFEVVSSHLKDTKLYSFFEECYTQFTKWQREVGYEKLLAEQESRDEGRVTIEKTKDNLISQRHRFLRFSAPRAVSEAIKSRMRVEGIDFRSYFLPLSFFLFIYFAGILISLPLINSIFTGIPDMSYIPLFDSNKNTIPFIVIQWGFFGGLVYTSISLLDRFLRKDLTPRVYFYASFRLLLSMVVAIIIYFLFLVANPGKGGSAQIPSIPVYILLLCFLSGVAPIQFLINFADSNMDRIFKGWKKRDVPGNRPISVLEGLNSIIAQRLDEEGINSIEQLSLIDPEEISTKTKYNKKYVIDWRDQAMLYLFTADIQIEINTQTETKHKHNNNNKHLLDILDEKIGIRTMTALIDIWDGVSSDTQKLQAFFRSLGFHMQDGDESYLPRLQYLFTNIVKQGRNLMQN